MAPTLDWVYGYRGKDSRANLGRLPTGEVGNTSYLGKYMGEMIYDPMLM